MNEKLLQQLIRITPEEQAILDGSRDIQKNIYSSSRDFVIDSRKMLEKGKLIDIRPHTRFIHFPRHRHNYIEIIYMCSGQTTHIINDATHVTLQKGELLFLNQNAYQEIEAAAYEDIAINFMILPEFFDQAFSMLKEENALRSFLVGTLRQDTLLSDYLHFQVSDILPVQNLMENMVWSILNQQTNIRSLNQMTMGLLLLQLMNHTDKISRSDPRQYERNLIFTTLRYIEENYKNGSLTELSELVSLPVYQLSRMIKQYSSHTFTDLLQTKKMDQAAYLLLKTGLPVNHIITAVGYDNSSYFHRLFKNRFGTTPHKYRLLDQQQQS